MLIFFTVTKVRKITYIRTPPPRLLNTIFGEVVSGLTVVDSIAAVKTTGSAGGDRPIEPVRIIRARFIKR